MDFLVQLLNGLTTFASTPVGAGIILAGFFVIVFALIKWTPTKVDDKWLAKFGPVLFNTAAIIEKAIPNGTQIKALQFVDKAAAAIQRSGQIDITDKKLMTVIKAELIKIAKASAKVDTSPEKLAELKNSERPFTGSTI